MLKEDWVNAHPEVILLETPSFDESFVGVTLDSRAVYDYDSMVCELANRFAIKDEFVYDHGVYMELARKFIEASILEELEYEADGPMVINLFEEK